ncbi:MAG: phycobilisome rod-core linker polypeptide [Cyanobacteria bacterium P01_D01_bin.44]
MLKSLKPKNLLGFLGISKESDASSDGTRLRTATVKKPAQPKSSKTKSTNKPAQPKSSVSAPPAQTVTTSPVINGRVQVRILPEDKAKTSADKYRDALASYGVVEHIDGAPSLENMDLVIRAAYKQVFGNAHIMDSERLLIAESQMRNGQITVSDFVRQLAQSDRYRCLFWDKYPNVTAIELNFKHLLGRAPESHEISEHIQIIAAGGFEAEIDSYLDSDEYFQTFGDYRVPYPRAYDTVGKDVVGFTRSFQLFGTACSSDKSGFGSDSLSAYASLMQDAPGSIPPLRPLPESFPEALTIGPEPRIPLEFVAMARQLLAKRNGTYYNY